MHIDADFPGGNIRVREIAGDRVVVKPDLRDSSWWFYWYFRVRGAAGRTIHVTLEDIHWVLSSLGPCVSTDSETWAWLGPPAEVNAFSYTIPPDADAVEFTIGIPYLERHLRAFLAARSAIAVSPLAVSERGRMIEHLHIPSTNGRYAVVFTARHHASEAAANYVLEGIIDHWLADPVLRAEVDLHAIPFVDKDGVEDGDPGKNRLPHDHNRDYTDRPAYAAVRALMAQAPTWRGELALALDLHCPWIRGEGDEQIYLYDAPEPWMRAQARLMDALEAEQTGPCRFNRARNPAWGSRGNEVLTTCSGWFRHHTPAWTANSLEFPYALANGVPVTVDTARAFGRDLGRAVGRYIREAR